jgi:hypothetical protein
VLLAVAGGIGLVTEAARRWWCTGMWMAFGRPDQAVPGLGEIRGEIAGPEINRLCDQASAAGMPMLG